jgi:C-5 cytosine-specific DNA methylase
MARLRSDYATRCLRVKVLIAKERQRLCSRPEQLSGAVSARDAVKAALLAAVGHHSRQAAALTALYAAHGVQPVPAACKTEEDGASGGGGEGQLDKDREDFSQAPLSDSNNDVSAVQLAALQAAPAVAPLPVRARIRAGSAAPAGETGLPEAEGGHVVAAASAPPARTSPLPRHVLPPPWVPVPVAHASMASAGGISGGGSPAAKPIMGFHLFAGTGAWAHALMPLTQRSFGYCEIKEQSQEVLRMAMAAGLIPEGQIFPDIELLWQDREFQRAMHAAQFEYHMFWTGSWPCKGSSCVGLHSGIDHSETALLIPFVEGITRFRPSFVALECVPPAANDEDQLGYIIEKLGTRYKIGWQTFKAEDLGAGIERNRLFVFLERKDCKLPRLPPHCLNDLLRSVGPEPPRCVDLPVS